MSFLRLKFLAGAVGLVAWKIGVLPRLGLGVRGRVAANAIVGVASVGIAHARGYGWRELGLSTEDVRRGLRVGASAACITLAGYGLAAAIPSLRERLVDVVAELELPEITEWALVHVPLGTVVAEELAFRSVLHAVAKRSLSPRVETLLQAVAFGMWHAYPDPDENTPVGAVVLATGLGGLLLSRLRNQSGSVIAPALLHLAVNSGGVLVGTAANRIARTFEARRPLELSCSRARRFGFASARRKSLSPPTPSSHEGAERLRHPWVRD